VEPSIGPFAAPGGRRF